MFFFHYKDYAIGSEREKESIIIFFIICVRMGQKNLTLVITVCHHSASLVIPIGNPRYGFFYPTPSIMMNSYCILQLFLSFFLFFRKIKIKHNTRKTKKYIINKKKQ